MNIQAQCSSCGKKFQKLVDGNAGQSSPSDQCYSCSLESLTKGSPPEEGDFNTARIRSGEMTEEERRMLWDDLKSVDWAACQPDPEDDRENRSGFDED